MAKPTNTQFAVAVHLLTLLADDPEHVLDSAALAISPATNPVRVRQILGHLRQHGLVHSQTGAHGGWSLARPPGQIDLAQVWTAVNGEDPVLGVHLPDPDCPVGRRVQRNLEAVDRRALEAILGELRGTSVADVLEEVRAWSDAGSG
jgi:Rrf2 family protein